MIEYYISSTKYSLQERNTKRGKVYDVVFRVVTLTGEEKQKKLCGFFTKTAAKEAYTDFVTEKCELAKHNPLKKKKGAGEPKKVEYTVRDLFPAYLTTLHNQTKESTIYDRQNIYRLFIAPTLAERKLTELTREALYQWQDELWATKNPKTDTFYSFEYLKKVRANLSAFLAWCETRYGYKNNLTEVKKPRRKEAKKEMLFWERTEFETFISSVDDAMYRTLFTLLFYVGCRKNEALALQKSDIKNDSVIITKSVLRKTIDGTPYKLTPTKAYKNREVPMCILLQKELKQYIETAPNGEFLFGGSRPLPETNVDRAFRKYIEKSGVKKIRIHDLRHSFVSLLIHLGANLTVVADLIGDTLEQVTKTYGHMYETDKRSIIAKLN